MTRSIGIAERIRWISALGAGALLALVLGLATLGKPAGLGVLADSPAATSGPVAGGAFGALDPRIAGLAARYPNSKIQTIVQFKSGVTPQRARWIVGRWSGRIFGQLHIINALAVDLTAQRARWLAADPQVRSVSLNSAVKTSGKADHVTFGPGRGHGHGPHGTISTRNLQTTYDGTLNATGAWRSGIDGSGIGVAVIDTGIAGGQPDFAATNGNGSRVVASAVTNPDAQTANDTYGHGTDVAGIIAGNGNELAQSDPLRGQYIGVAPGANLVSVKVADESGNATVLDVIYGLQFAIDHKADYNIRVVNLSLDSRTPQSYRTDPLDAAAEAAWFHGIVVVAAAGNRGTDSDAVQYAPANDPFVITVGAVNENGTATPGDDFIPGWSSRGVTQDGFTKPDVYAPGAHIVSVLAPNSAFAQMCPVCTIGGDYIRTSGTSMAAGMVSGAVADVLQAHPTWGPDQVKAALTSHGVAANPAIQEVDTAKLLGLAEPPPVDVDTTPNSLIDTTSGGIDYSRASWSRASWSTATGSLSAGFARASWSRASWSSNGSDGVDSSRASWSRASWSTYFDRSSANG